MNRQPSLAELLADNTNNIRPEVADLLLQPHARLAQAAPPAPPVPRIRVLWGRCCLALGFIVLLVYLSYTFLKSEKADAPGSAVTLRTAQTITAQTEQMRTLKTGRVIGESVSIRTQPNLQGEIIKTVNQNDWLKVISFHNGWYRVALPGRDSGYIFGAYLLPQDFDSHPYHAVLAKDDQAKLLVRVDDNPVSFSVLWPDGQTTRILKENVAKHH